MNQSPEVFKSPETEAKPLSPIESFDNLVTQIGLDDRNTYAESQEESAFRSLHPESDKDDHEISAINDAISMIVENLLSKSNLEIGLEEKTRIREIFEDAARSYALDVFDKYHPRIVSANESAFK